MTTRPLQFVRRGQTVTLHDVPPDRTLLEVLREDLHCTDTKEGCNEGDCGACTVVLAEAQGARLQYRAVNSCIRLAHSIDGMALWTAADLARPDGTLHPVQQAMVECHGSQCGFCTPGLIVAVHHLLDKNPDPTELQVKESISGNICRCTGYGRIFAAVEAVVQVRKASR